MPPPSKGQVKVATDALRSEAGIWHQQSDELGKIVGRTEDLRLSRVEAGLFQVVFDAYESVVDQVSARCGEARQCMTDIADTLHQVADTYDDEDAANMHRFKNLY